jgi:hypothetical protein
MASVNLIVCKTNTNSVVISCEMRILHNAKPYIVMAGPAAVRCSPASILSD